MKRAVLCMLVVGLVLVGAGCVRGRIVTFKVPRDVVVNKGATVAVLFNSRSEPQTAQLRIVGVSTNGVVGEVVK